MIQSCLKSSTLPFPLSGDMVVVCVVASSAVGGIPSELMRKSMSLSNLSLIDYLEFLKIMMVDASNDPIQIKLKSYWDR